MKVWLYQNRDIKVSDLMEHGEIQLQTLYEFQEVGMKQENL